MSSEESSLLAIRQGLHLHRPFMVWARFAQYSGARPPRGSGLMPGMRGYDEQYLGSDAVFTDMSSGLEWIGREAVAGMLHWFYEVAFDATFENRTLIVDDEHGMLEGMVVGRHIGEFAGIPATGRDFRAPICVVYDFRDEQIARGRFYFAVPAFLAQVGAAPVT